MKQNNTLIDILLPKLRPPKTWWDKCLKTPISDDPWTSKMVNVLKHCWNQLQSIFIIFIDYWQVNSVKKGLCFWHAKSWDSFLTHWLETKSILLLIETILRYQFRCNYLRNKKIFLSFLLHLWNLQSVLNILKKKDDPHRSNISEITDSKSVVR